MKSFCVASVVVFTSLVSAHAAPVPGFTVNFSNCSEFVGVGPVDLTQAAALVPSGFTTLVVGTSASIVVRATSCARVTVNGGRAIPTVISQIGVQIVPPDGTGDINNYTLIYVTNNLDLVLAFQSLGLAAIFDPTITYEFTYDYTGKAGELYVKAGSFNLPDYFLTGTEADPASGGIDFKANWWFAARAGRIKQASEFPNIAFGPANVGLHTSRNSVLGRLIGGNTDADFHFLPVRGLYASANMQVTLLISGF